MVIIVISLFMIVIAVIDRFLTLQKSNDTVNSVCMIRTIIMVLIHMAIYLLAYFVTDTTVDFVYIFFTIWIGHTLIIAIASWRRTKLTNFIVIIISPLFVILFIEAIPHTLIDMGTVFTPISLSATILTYDNKNNKNKWSFFSNTLGFLIAVMLIFFFFFYENNNNVIQNKQEVVANQFLKEELNLSASTIYTQRKLRGEESIVMAYTDSGDKRITMIYRNNSIISYEIKDM